MSDKTAKEQAADKDLIKVLKMFVSYFKKTVSETPKEEWLKKNTYMSRIEKSNVTYAKVTDIFKKES